MDKVFLKFVVSLVGSMIFFSCASAPLGDSSSSSSSSSNSGIEMPSQITMEVPNSLKNENELKLKAPFKAPSEEEQSHAAKIVKMYTSWGVGVTKFIDTILSNVYQIKDYLVANMGREIILGDAKFFFNTNEAGIYYIYIIKTNSNLTNLYIDWQKANDSFKGRARLIPEGQTETKEAIVLYDYTITEPTLDIYMLFNANNSDGISKFRLNLKKVGEGRVIVKSKVIIDTNNIINTNNFITSWNLVGYGDKNGDGGVYASTTGFNQGTNWTNFSTSSVIYITNEVTNFTISNEAAYYVTNIFAFSNYTYEEYFNSNGIILWNLAEGEANYTIHNHIFATDYISIFQATNQIVYITNIILITNINIETTNTYSNRIFQESTPETSNIFQIFYIYENKVYSNITIVDPNICNTNSPKPSLTVDLNGVPLLETADYTNIILP